jgi:hypothetical protein
VSGMRSIVRTVKTAADAAIATLWLVVMTTYLVGLHHEAHTFGDAAAGWTLAWFLVRHPRLVLEFAFVGLAASVAVVGRDRSKGRLAR